MLAKGNILSKNLTTLSLVCWWEETKINHGWNVRGQFTGRATEESLGRRNNICIGRILLSCDISGVNVKLFVAPLPSAEPIVKMD